MTPHISAAIECFRDRLPGRITTPGTDTIVSASNDFTTLTNQPWSSTCWQTAAAYILLQNTTEVSTAVSIIKQTGIKLVVRSTGHNPNPGFSSIGSDGIVLDLGKLRSGDLIDDKNGNGKVARVGAGIRWGTVYDWLEELGLSAIGGRDPSVGMGLLVGGGLGAVPNLHRLATDGVCGFEAVLSDGRIIIANAQENANLYRALKGGGNNKPLRPDHSLIPLQYSISLYNPTDYVNINRATVELQEVMEAGPKIGSFTNYQPFVAVGLITAGYSDSASEGEHEAFKPFDVLESKMMEACPPTKGTLGSLAKIMAHAAGDAKKKYVSTLTTTPSQDLYSDTYHAWCKALGMLPKDAVLHYTIQSVGSSCVRRGESNGGNSRLLTLVSLGWVFTVEWPRESSPDDDEAARNAVRYLVKKVEEAAESRDQLLPYLCATFASSDQSVLRSYGSGNVEVMRAVVQKYDPHGVFKISSRGPYISMNFYSMSFSGLAISNGMEGCLVISESTMGVL
ncbi:hypothetical protein BJX63DRAFT_419895 [Aspergillus granulosus]|uniref:FAD-binding PCMH-type domain-containing protein n=1 Tax=Aspergillus granulosus TaxID=176169 RepID=A0ABR4HMK3_9EURO